MFRPCPDPFCRRSMALVALALIYCRRNALAFWSAPVLWRFPLYVPGPLLYDFQNGKIIQLLPPLAGESTLFGIAQRQIRVSRSHIPANRHPRKSLCMSIQTLGTPISNGLCEKKLTPLQIAQKNGNCHCLTGSNRARIALY